jgi:hypothetical protein
MNLFFRRSIILLLFVLQGFAPLVHAHVQEDGGEYGLHIYGINLAAEKIPQFSSIKAKGHSEVTIGLRSAIQHKNLLINDLPISCFTDYTQYSVCPPFKEPLQFSLLVFQNKPSINLSICSPRAPPSTSFI